MLETIKEHLLQTVAAAVMLGSGGLLLSSTIDNAKQDTRIERLEKLDERLDTISRDVATTRETVVRLETRMNGNE